MGLYDATSGEEAKLVARAAILVMGVSGAGKTTLARPLAAALGLPFIEGDDLHAPESVAKMRGGVPLTDEDRAPWLARVGGALRGGGVAACSALARRHRDAIRAALGRDALFVFLDVPRAELERRLAARSGHFMPASLLQSQLDLLEPPAQDEAAITVSPPLNVAEVAAACTARFAPS